MADPIGVPVTWYCPSLDDTGNGTTTLYDLSVTGHDTNLYNGIAWNTTDTDDGGVRSLDFSATDHFTWSAYNAAQRVLGDWTGAVWIKPDDVSGTQGVLFFGRSGGFASYNTLYSIYLKENEIYYAHESGVKVYHEVEFTDAANVITASEWNHVACVRDATARTVTLWINGIEIDTSSYLTDPANGGASSTILGTFPTVSNSFSGLIDDVLIYDYQLSDTNISKLAATRGAVAPTTNRRRRLLLVSG